MRKTFQSGSNLGWLHQVEPARLRSADRPRAWLANTVPPNKADVPGPKGRDSLVSNAVKSANRHADIAVASSVSALFPEVPPGPPRLRPWEVFQRGSFARPDAP